MRELGVRYVRIISLNFEVSLHYAGFVKLSKLLRASKQN